MSQGDMMRVWPEHGTVRSRWRHESWNVTCSLILKINIIIIIIIIIIYFTVSFILFWKKKSFPSITPEGVHAGIWMLAIAFPNKP